MDFPVESYSFLPGSRAILDLSYRSRLRNSNYAMSQQSIPTISMGITPSCWKHSMGNLESLQFELESLLYTKSEVELKEFAVSIKLD